MRIRGQTSLPTLHVVGTQQLPDVCPSSFGALSGRSVDRCRTAQMAVDVVGLMKQQRVKCGLVCVLQGGGVDNSPCNTHDNFLRPLLQLFFCRPERIWNLESIWDPDPYLRELMSVTDSMTTSSSSSRGASKVTHATVPVMKLPQGLTLQRAVELGHRGGGGGGFEVGTPAFYGSPDCLLQLRGEFSKVMEDEEELILQDTRAASAARMRELRRHQARGETLGLCAGRGASKKQRETNTYTDDDDNLTAAAAAPDPYLRLSSLLVAGGDDNHSQISALTDASYLLYDPSWL